MSSMSVSGIHGQLLEVTVVGCTKLKDTEWISRQDPYVCLEYGTSKFRTRTHKDGGKNPVFQEKFVFTLIEGLRDLKVVVWNSNSLSYDDLIGTGMIQLQRVLSQGFDDTPWPLHSKTGRHAGEVRLIMHYSQANKPATSYAPSAPSYGAPHSPHISQYSVPHSSHSPHISQYSVPHSSASYPAPSPYPAYPPAPAAYPHHPPQPSAYPPAYPPPPSPYPPQPSAYPPAYPSPPSPYPPQYPNSGSSYYPPGPYQGAYPPPPYN